MGKWASKHSRRGSSTRTSQKSGRAYSASQDDHGKSKPSTHASELFQHNDVVTCVDSWKGKLCLSGSCDGTILLQDTLDKRILNQTWKHEKETTKVRVQDDIILSASRDKTVKIWKTGIPDEQSQLLGHTLAVTAIDCDGQFNHVYSGSRDNSVRLWDLGTGTCIEENKISRNLVTDVCVSSELGLVFQTSEDRVVKLWDSRDLQMLHSFPTQNQIQTSCDVKGNIAITSNNGFSGSGCEISVWDLRERKLLQTLRGHTETVTSCKFLPDNQRFVSCSHDGTVRLWDIEEQSTAISTLHVNCGNLSCLTALYNHTILCGSYDEGILKISITNDNLSFG